MSSFRAILPLCLIAVFSAPASWASDADAVRAVLLETFDKPEARLQVDPVTIDGDVAVAGWLQGDLGGRALLRRKGDGWMIDLCAGDALTQSESFEKLGLSKPRADALAAAVRAAESGLEPNTREKFSRFDGVFAVDQNGEHTPVDPHHRPIR